MLRISNIAHLPTKPDQEQKLEDWRENQNNQASSLQLRQNQRENKIKKSELAYWLNYNKAEYLSHLLQFNTVKFQ